MPCVCYILHAMASTPNHVTVAPFSQRALMCPMIFTQPMLINQGWDADCNLVAIPEPSIGFPFKRIPETVTQ